MPGKLIVIDGGDGSGKGTQFNLLLERLQKMDLDVQVKDFPQYGKKSAGAVEEYLNGVYGSPEDVGPYRASIFFAVDRYDASFEMREWLNSGAIVLCNRYVTANLGHQGGKIKDEEEWIGLSEEYIKKDNIIEKARTKKSIKEHKKNISKFREEINKLKEEKK